MFLCSDILDKWDCLLRFIISPSNIRQSKRYNTKVLWFRTDTITTGSISAAPVKNDELSSLEIYLKVTRYMDCGFKTVRASDKISQADIKLPSPPAIAMRILEVVKKEETCFDELAKIITADPALTSRILRVANSSFYALPNKVDSIQRAIAVLGSDVLKNIALSFVIANDMRAESEDAFDFDFFWKRSVTAAVSANLLASLTGKKSDDVFVTALLQDIGVVIMYLSRPEDYIGVLAEKKASGVPMFTAEAKIFGFDHQEIGMQALKQWGLPASIYEPVGCHHEAENGTAGSKILYLSDMLSSIYHGTHGAQKMQSVKSILHDDYGIERAQIDNLVDKVAYNSVQIMSFFQIDPGDMKPFSSILQEANQELGKANLSYEQLVIELKQAKEVAENLAAELTKANDKLKALAFKDGLTGLYNHRYFQEQMDKEVGRAIRYKRQFSLLLFDIDHFKTCNDTYGHPAGDLVLKRMATTIMKMIHNADVAARYGGEEFAVALPETDLKGAVVLAERLRKKIEAMVVEADGHKIGVTVSIGLTTWQPEHETINKAALIGAADKALYKSKKKGRNTISYCDPT